MKNQKLNPNDVEFLRPLTERPDLEPDAQFVRGLKQRLKAEANKQPKRNRFAAFNVAAITVITAAASLFLLLNVAQEKPAEISESEPEIPPVVADPGEMGQPVRIESSEQIVELFSVNYGIAEDEIGEPVKMKGGSDLTPMSFFVKDDVFYILDNAGKKVVVTDGTVHLLTIQLDEEARLKDIFVDDENNIYVLDEGGRAVIKYSEEGKLVDTFLIERESFIPTEITVNRDQEILVHQSSDVTFNLTKDEISPYSKQFGETIAIASRVSETEGTLKLTENGEETVFDIPFEHSYGALIIHEVNQTQLIYEKTEVFQEEDGSIATDNHIYVVDKDSGNFFGAVRIPKELPAYYAEHRTRMDNNEIYFMSPEEDGVHFYLLKPGAQEPVIDEPEQQKEQDKTQQNEEHNSPEEKDGPVETEPPVEKEQVPTYLTKSFFNQLREGHIPGADIRIGATMKDLKNQLGDPIRIEELEGGYLHDYGTYGYIQPALQDTIIGILMNIKEDGVTGEEFATAWGEPTNEGSVIHPYAAYSMTYTVGETYLITLEMNSSRKDPVKYIRLLKIGGE